MKNTFKRIGLATWICACFTVHLAQAVGPECNTNVIPDAYEID